MKITKYSHKCGERVVSRTVRKQVEGALIGLELPTRKRSATNIRRELLDDLRRQGWSDKVRISAKRGLTLTAKRGNTALCVQTGNMARFYADLLKLQAQFLDGKITSAVYVLPNKIAANQMGQNMANFERLTSELSTMFAKVITVPLLVYGFEQDSEERGV